MTKENGKKGWSLFLGKMACLLMTLFLLLPVFSAAVHIAPSFAEGEESTVLFPCSDVDRMTSYTQSGQASLAAKMAAGKQANDATLKNMFEKNIQLVDIGAFCIDKLILYYSILEALIGLADGILSSLSAILVNLIDQACDYVVDEIVTNVQNALNKVCIPMPTISGFDGFSSDAELQTCDGVSLADYAGVTPVRAPSWEPLPRDFLSKILVPMLQDNPLLKGKMDIPLRF